MFIWDLMSDIQKEQSLKNKVHLKPELGNLVRSDNGDGNTNVKRLGHEGAAGDYDLTRARTRTSLLFLPY